MAKTSVPENGGENGRCCMSGLVYDDYGENDDYVCDREMKALMTVRLWRLFVGL